MVLPPFPFFPLAFPFPPPTPAAVDRWVTGLLGRSVGKELAGCRNAMKQTVGDTDIYTVDLLPPLFFQLKMEAETFQTEKNTPESVAFLQSSALGTFDPQIHPVDQ